MPGFLRTPLAEADLLSIGRYVAEHSQSTSTALRLLDGIDEKCRILARHPHASSIRLRPASRGYAGQGAWWKHCELRSRWSDSPQLAAAARVQSLLWGSYQ